MSKHDEDFVDFLKDPNVADLEQQREQAMLDAHEEWRNTTWAGWIVKQLQELGRHLLPFTRAVGEALRDDKHIGTRLLGLLLRLSVIFVLVAGVMFAARIVQMVIGKDIVVEREVVILEEVPRSKAEKEGIVEGEQELTYEEAKKRLGEEALREVLGNTKPNHGKKDDEKDEKDEKEETTTTTTGKSERRSARDKKNQ